MNRPWQTASDFIAAFVARHGIVYEFTGSSALAQAITGLAGEDDAKPDATECLVIALRRAGVIDGATMVMLLGRYFDEKRNRRQGYDQ
ncbi:hypothetical protein [Roseateles sp. LKC17W]|uniref:Uncharacterized protein n=1 Tax=Pelomonas margarita TaxID=3299031 RepID=A0ABW7FQE8_9BURK